MIEILWYMLGYLLVIGLFIGYALAAIWSIGMFLRAIFRCLSE